MPAFLRSRACRIFVATVLGFAGWIGAHAQTAKETVVYSFSGTTDSTTPTDTLIQAGDGQMYGTTFGNIFTDFGSVYKISLDGTFTSVYHFGGVTDSATPQAPLVQGVDGNFYSTTFGNLLLGTQGSVYSVTPAGVLTTLYNFTGGSDGGAPLSGLTPLSDGTFYGTTSSGGANYGTVFSIGPASALSTIFSFNGFNGNFVASPLVEGLDGNFYGVTGFGGPSNLGTVYQLTPSGTMTTLYSFAGTGDGGVPTGGLLEGPDGNFYGATSRNGAVTGVDQNGTIFKITPSGVLTTLHTFTSAADGGGPSALFLGGDGYLYGTTSAGGANNAGTVFRISLSGALTSLYSFGAAPDTAAADTGVLQASDGTFWGTGETGGSSANGAIFKLALSPAPAAPVQLTASASTMALGDPLTLNWSSLNSFSNTMRQCNASVAPDPTSAPSWAGAQAGSFNTTTNVWSGSSTFKPLREGTYTFGITCGGIESATTTVTVGDAAKLLITSQSLPTAYVNVPYSTTVGISGGVSPYTFSVNVGSLPAGLTLNPSTGVISGTPKQTGASSFTIKVADSNPGGAGIATANLGLSVLNQLALNTTKLPDARIGSPYSQQLVASGGTPPYTFALLTGSTLPAGLTLSISGLVSGTPTATASDTFEVKLSDSGGQGIASSLSLTVDPLITTTGVLTLTPSMISFGGTTAASVTITSPSGSPVMTGTVQFEANGLPLGSPAPLTNGVATLTTPAMMNSGNITIAAFYSGDSNFQALTYPPQTLTVNALAQPAIVIAPSVASVASGSDAQVTVNLLGFASGTSVAMSCGQLPAFVSCSFSPVANNASTLTIHTETTTGANSTGANKTPNTLALAALFPGILLIGLAARRRKLSRKALGTVSVLLSLAIGMTITGCGSHTTINKTGTGVSTITVTATAGAQVASAELSLSVH